MPTLDQNSPLYWILGRGGLLGSHLEAEIHRLHPTAKVWVPMYSRFNWNQPKELKRQLESATAHFAMSLENQRPWTIAWTAGSGVINSDTEALLQESETFKIVLDLLGKYLNPFLANGTIFLASSAGAIFAGTKDMPATEESQPVPISEYGRQKLYQEKILNDFSLKHSNLKVLIGRISTLYGPGQNLNKPQGLISQMCRALTTNTPINIYVPLDTVRDYLYVEDCAAAILRTLNYLQSSGWPQSRIMKIFASEVPSSINQIVECFEAPELPRLLNLTQSTILSPLHPRSLSFHSQILPDLAAKTALRVGIKRTLAAQVAIQPQSQDENRVQNLTFVPKAA